MPAFVLSNLLRNYFYAGTIFFAWVAWIVALAGVASVESAANGGKQIQTAAYGTGWWNLWMCFFLLIAFMVSIVSTSSSTLHCSLAGYRYTFALFFAISMAYIGVDLTGIRASINLANQLNLASAGAGAYMAGFIMLGMVWVSWIVALTVDPNTIIYQLVYQLLASPQSPLVFAGAPPPQQQQKAVGQPQLQQPVPGSQPQSFKAMNNDMSPQYTAPVSMQTPSAVVASPPQSNASVPSATPVAGNTAAVMRAKALYSYTANPDDPNELTFEKGEQFKVLDNKGKWWQVQTQAGKVGIVPSNYMQLIQ